jgi:CBS domain-containing protein
VKELVGIITEKDIASHLGSSKYGNMAPSHFHASTVMTSDPLTVESNRSIGAAAKTMIENKIGGMPVVDDGEIVGIITKTDFISNCQGRPFNEIKVEERMTRDMITISAYERLVHARRLIIDENIGRIPVLGDSELEGIVTAKDIANSMMSFRKVVPDKYKHARIRNLLVEDVMTQNVKTISKEAFIDETATIMVENSFSGLPVVDGKDLVGIITKTDLLNLIVELEEVS